MNETKKDEETVATGGKGAFKRTKPALTVPAILELSRAAPKAQPGEPDEDNGNSR